MRVTLNSVRGKVGTRVKYAASQHEGSVPHFIRPRRKKALRFYWEAVGKTVIFRKVYHPGTGATPFLTSSARESAKRNGFRWRRTITQRASV